MAIRSSNQEQANQIDGSVAAIPSSANLVTLSQVYIAASIVLLALLSYWVFPGHLYRFEDTQIYLPMLERRWDPSLLKNDFLATRSHLTFTIYDNVALVLRRLTGWDFRGVLILQQWIFRAIALLGVYLVARALKFSEALAVWVAAIFALGATTVGVAISSVEFEPVPRTFAFALILLALGMTANGRYLEAGIAGGIAFLYHPPIGYPFWAIYFVLAAGSWRRHSTEKRILAFLPLLCACILLFIVARPKIAASPPEPLFRGLDPIQEQLQRFVAPYNWVSMWPFAWLEHHLFLWAVAGLAFWRIRRSVNYDLRFFLLGLPLVGILSIPASYVLLDRLKWSFVPQFQPMRALVYLAVIAGILTAAAGAKAVEQGRYGETFLWFAVAYAIPTEARVLHILTPRLLSLAVPDLRRRVIIVAVLASSAGLVIRSLARRRRWAALLLTTSMLLPFFLLRYYGHVNEFPLRDNPELEDVSRWARASTPKDAVFLFPDAGLNADPTTFRSTALRSVYIDWKSSGQVNFFRDFAYEWWSRWQKAMARPFNPQSLETYRALGIDYLVVRAAHRIPGITPVFENSRYIVYQLGRSSLTNLEQK